jgi:hypothetical protein
MLGLGVSEVTADRHATNHPNDQPTNRPTNRPRRYSRWAAAQGYKVTVAERSPGEEAGIKSCELVVEGRFAYGLLKGGAGPFGTQAWKERACF